MMMTGQRFFFCEDEHNLTDGPLALWIVLFRDVMRSLVLEVGYRDISLGKKKYLCGAYFRK